MAARSGSDFRQRIRNTLRIWLAVYPSALLFYTLFGDLVRHWPLPLRLLVSSVTVVTFVTNFGEPLIQRFGEWIGQVRRRLVRARTKSRLSRPSGPNSINSNSLRRNHHER